MFHMASSKPGKQGPKPGYTRKIAKKVEFPPLHMPSARLNSRQKARWAQVIKRLPPDYLTAEHMDSMELYVKTWCDWEDAYRECEATERISESYDDRTSGCHKVEEQLAMRLIRLSKSLGFYNHLERHKSDTGPEESPALKLLAGKKSA